MQVRKYALPLIQRSKDARTCKLVKRVIAKFNICHKLFHNAPRYSNKQATAPQRGGRGRANVVEVKRGGKDGGTEMEGWREGWRYGDGMVI